MPQALTQVNVDINHGVDFEIELEQRQAAAGKAFQHYRDLKLDPGSTDEQIDAARLAYIEARERVRAIKLANPVGAAAENHA